MPIHRLMVSLLSLAVPLLVPSVSTADVSGGGSGGVGCGCSTDNPAIREMMRNQSEEFKKKISSIYDSLIRFDYRDLTSIKYNPMICSAIDCKDIDKERVVNIVEDIIDQKKNDEARGLAERSLQLAYEADKKQIFLY